MKQILLRMRTLTALAVVLTLILAGCGAAPAPKNGDFRIVTSFYPMYVFTRNITEGIAGVSVTNMTEPQTGCLHDYQLRPSDLASLESADAFVLNGAGMESFLDRVTGQYPDLTLIEAAAGMELLTDESGESNPHVWVAVGGAIEEVRNIAEGLAAADPTHAGAYRANAAAYTARLEALSKEMHDSLDALPNRKIVTFHEAFPYFAEEFGLEIVAVIEREPGSEPGAGELADTIRLIKDTGVRALFAEPQYAPKAAQTIADETGATVYSLDPFVTGDSDAPADSYETTMRANLAVLLKALGMP